jgi:hypothetical protein
MYDIKVKDIVFDGQNFQDFVRMHTNVPEYAERIARCDFIDEFSSPLRGSDRSMVTAKRLHACEVLDEGIRNC